MRGQLGFWDLDDRYERLSAAGDPLEKLNSIIPWPVFEKRLAKALKRSDGSKGGQPAFPLVLMFKILVLQALYNLSDEQAEFVIQDRCHSCGSSTFPCPGRCWMPRLSGCSARTLFGPVPSAICSPVSTNIYRDPGISPRADRSSMRRSFRRPGSTTARTKKRRSRLARSPTSGRTNPPSSRRRIATRVGR